MNAHNSDTNAAQPAGHPTTAQRHMMDYVRLVYKRRWAVGPVFLILFVISTVNALRQTPIYESRTQLVIESDTPKVARLDQMFQQDASYYDDEFRQTQFRVLQSRSVARRAIDALKLWDAPRLGHGPEPKATISVTGLVWNLLFRGIDLAKGVFVAGRQAPSQAPIPSDADSASHETAAQSRRIDEFLGDSSIVPIRNSRVVEIRYASTDPAFAAEAANALAKAYIKQNLEARFSTSKDAADWLSDRLAEQRSALETSEAALQAFKEENGTVSVADSASNIVVQRLTDLNGALTKAKTERINREAQYNQLKAAQRAGALDSLPSVLANEYVQKLRSDLSDLERQQVQLAQRYGERHAEMIKMRAAIETAGAKLQIELAKVVDSVKNEYEAALGEERSLQSALNGQKTEALSLNRKGIEYGVLQREVESNKQIYESLMQRTKETGISAELRTTNLRVLDEAEVPRSPISPNMQRDLTFSFGGSLLLAVALAFFLDQFDSRMTTPQEMKTHLGIPFLGLKPSAKKDENPLITNGVPPNFIEAIKTIRTNVLFSSTDDGARLLVVTSAGPHEGKSVVAANLAIALAQTTQRVLLVDGDMRRPRVHQIFDVPQEPGLSNLLTNNGKPGESAQRAKMQQLSTWQAAESTRFGELIRRSTTPNLWLLPSGRIPPNPAELLGLTRYLDFVKSLNGQFDWVIIDTPPVLAVTDSTVAANSAAGVVFVVGSEKTSRQAARTAVEQLDAGNAHFIGSVLNNVRLHRHPYYYPAYHRKAYANYYAVDPS